MKTGHRVATRFTKALNLRRGGGKGSRPSANRYTSAGPLVGMGLLGILFLGVVLLQTWCWTCRHIDETAGRQAHLAVEFGKSLRNYVGKYVRPEMEKRVNPGEFIPEAMSTSFVARSVLEDVRTTFPDTILRFATRNPRNPRNQAAPAEEALIQYFEQRPDQDMWSGTMEFTEGGAKYFVCAIPRRFEASCLKCHGQPGDAPAALLARYGTVAGFGRSVGEVSVDLAAIPVSASYAAARTQVTRHMLMALGLCVLFLAGIAFLIGADARRRRSAEETLRRSEERLRRTLEAAQTVAWEGDLQGETLVETGPVGALFGLPQGPVGTDRSAFLERIHPQDRPRVLAAMQSGATGEGAYDVEYRVLLADGDIRWIQATGGFDRDADGRPVRLRGIARDITARKQVEEALHRERDRAQGYLDVADVMLLALDETGHITLINRKGGQILGYEQAQLLGRNWFETCLPVSVREKVRAIFDLLMAGEVEPAEYTEGLVRTRSGAERILAWHNTIVCDEAGKIVGTLSSGEDITERRHAEEKQTTLIHKLSDVNRELQDFAYVVSHDLKAPLRAIKTLADWLLADYQDKLDAQGKENLQLLGSRVNRMHNLIDGVLQYSRVGRTEQGTKPVDLGQLLPQIVADLGVPEHIAIHLPDNLPTVEADPTRITQVFQNLLSNAVKYIDKPEGRITVACREEGDFWKFRVSDNGPGIAQKDFERVFKLFQTLGRRDDGESTGVGLTITKKIIEMYGGTIWVESEVGQGSTFCFTFPRSRANVAAETLQTCAVG